MRKLMLMLTVILPGPLKNMIYRWVFGWKIGRNVSIGLSFIDAEKVSVGDHVRIGHFNVVRNLKRLEIGSGSCIRNFNQIFMSGDKAKAPDWAATLRIGTRASIMSHHFFDLGGSVTIGDRVTFAGRSTQVWSHGYIFTDEGREHLLRRIEIGSDVYIGARTTIVGEQVPGKCVIGAGSVVSKSHPQEDCRILLAGNPASVKKRYANVREVAGEEQEVRECHDSIH